MKLHVKQYGWLAACLLLVGGNVWLYLRNKTLGRQLEIATSRTNTLEEKETQSYVVERISKQMEEIASQQKEISDAQREKAIYQMGVANWMRLRAEAERRKAEEFADSVVAARNMMEQQREMAIRQRRAAEEAKSRSDSLSYLALGRMLASLSGTQYQAGNHDISALLAYAAWYYTSTYNGNVHAAALFHALSLNSGSFLTEELHKGGIMQILPLKGKDGWHASVSKYGEIQAWRYANGKWDKQLLFSDPSCDFRDATIDAKALYALSFTGTLKILSSDGSIQTVNLPEPQGWSRICPFNEQQLLLASSQNLYLYDKDEQTIVHTVSLPEPLSAIGVKGNDWLIFGQGGGMWKLTPELKLEKLNLYVRGTVTAYAWSKEQQMAAAGMKNGDIYLIDSEGNTVRRLVGHRSRITQLTFNDGELLSSSYDHTLSLWDLNLVKTERVTLGSFNNWIYCFCLSENGTVWVGDESGVVSRVLTSPNEMAQRVQNRLKRDFTDDEWNYYIGSNVARVRMKAYLQQRGDE